MRLARSKFLLFFVAFIAAILLSISGGCGGSGGSSSSPTRGSVNVVLDWAMSRAITLPATIQSARILISDESGQQLHEIVVARPATASQTTNRVDVPLTRIQIQVLGYPSADASGTPSASATQRVVLDAKKNEVEFVADPSEVAAVVVDGPTAVALGEGSSPVQYTARAVNSEGQTVLADLTFSWSAEGNSLYQADHAGHYQALSVGRSIVTAREEKTGLSGSLPVRVGFPINANVTVEGSRGPVLFHATSVEDAATLAQPSPAIFSWENYSSVVRLGNAFALAAPETYGDRQFVKWQVNGADVSGGAMLSVDPKAFASNAETVPQTQFRAVYTPRLPGPDGFTPNYKNDTDLNSGTPNQTVLWNLSRIRITFSTQGNFSADKKAQAVAGFGWYDRATAGYIHPEILPDNDFDDAEIIVTFPVTPNAPETHPGNWIPLYQGYTIQQETSTGQTFYALSGQGPQGDGKRVILIFNEAGYEDIPVVACHELGHAFGLNGHSENKEDVMFPSDSLKRQPFLSGRDVNTFMTLFRDSIGDPTRAHHAAGGGTPAKRIAIP